MATDHNQPWQRFLLPQKDKDISLGNATGTSGCYPCSERGEQQEA
jgi:hypothetical protein